MLKSIIITVRFLGVSPSEVDDNEENLGLFNQLRQQQQQLRTAIEDLGTRYDKVEDLCPRATHCLFMDILPRGSFNLAEEALRTPLEPESVKNFGEPQASLEQLRTTKGARQESRHPPDRGARARH
ncbi:hypothetical protein HPB49_002488 [Dermacentor silvarum]|uniref:Uncharacterized protein n=1 Tax=Dermacentor silvarum TaxID=543639 RepID=A0ACB8DSS5_DERSI|nr:hypothetical protein HPB49_002488 [Dermacentor silvarum]